MLTLSPIKIIFIALSLGVATAAPSFFHWGGKPDPSIGEVVKKDLIQKVTVAGTIIPFKRSLISAPYNGYIQKIYVKVGQQVKANDPLVSIVQSVRNLAEPVYPMRAPFDGIVVQVSKTEGEYVEINKDTSGILRIDNLTKLFSICDVPETNVANLKEGMEVIIKPNSGDTKEYKGMIREVFLAAKEKQQGWGRPGDRVNFEVKIEILDIDSNIRPGMSAIVDIITGKKSNVLTLRQEFIEKNTEGFFVTLKNGKKKKIEVGLSNEEDYEVTSGLSESERIKMVDFASLPQM